MCSAAGGSNTGANFAPSRLPPSLLFPDIGRGLVATLSFASDHGYCLCSSLSLSSSYIITTFGDGDRDSQTDRLVGRAGVTGGGMLATARQGFGFCLMAVKFARCCPVGSHDQIRGKGILSQEDGEWGRTVLRTHPLPSTASPSKTAARGKITQLALLAPRFKPATVIHQDSQSCTGSNPVPLAYSLLDAYSSAALHHGFTAPSQ